MAELRESDLVDSIGMEHKLHLKKLLLARQKLTPLSASEESMASSVRREEAATTIREGIPDIETAFSQVLATTEGGALNKKRPSWRRGSISCLDNHH